MKSALPLKIVIPLLLGIVASLAITVYAEFGFRRLEIANRQMAIALEMQAALHEALALIVDAETGQRGYLITGKEEYLQPYQAALPKIGDAFHRLRELLVLHGTPEQRDALGKLNELFGKKLLELEAMIALYKKDGPDAAQALINTGIGRRTMDEIRATVDQMLSTHRRQIDDATRRWSGDIAFARLGMEIMTAFTVALLLVVWLLARRDAQQREERRRSMQQDQDRLEALVQDRTADLSELSNYLQVVREDEKSKLARDIHDELGGVLVSAKMDVAWVEKRIKGRDPEATVKLERALQALDDGVQIKRRIIEDLRPTLLDNLGLAAAIDWQVNDFCNRAGLKCTLVLPADDAQLAPRVSIALYRILQEALTNIGKYARAKNVRVELSQTSDNVALLIEDDGVGIPDGAQKNKLSHGISGMRQRVRALQGEFSIGRPPEGGTRIEVNIPLEPTATEQGAASRADAPA
ncbi:MAG TPA: CHASE3 domain-containing protein [Casimicrobiaceae bacterium]|nr:CHASE3 domain-containing protein [Casimicrobiaceae bacterium]